MNIIHMVIIGIVATLMIALLKPVRPELAILIGVTASVFILIRSLDRLKTVVTLLQSFADQISLDSQLVAIVLKIIGVSYLCEFGAQICKDAGEKGISTKIELAGKVTIVYLASPILVGLFQLLTGML